MGDGVTSYTAGQEWQGSPQEVLAQIAGTVRCSALLEIWRAARGLDSPIPLKSGLDPITLAKAGLLPFVWLLELDRLGSFFYRLVGEGVRRHFPTPVRGRHLSELYDGETRDLVTEHCRRVLLEHVILFASGTVHRDGQAIYYAKRILLPLCDGEGETRYLIGTTDQSQVDERPGRGGGLRFSNDFASFLPIDVL